MNWFIKVIKQYADFKGRARRKEFWMFTLFSMLLGFIVQLLDVLLGYEFFGTRYGPIYGFYTLFLFVPSLAVSVRRLHDTGRSGWYLLLWFFILIGWIWLLVLHCIDSQPGENKFGPNPKGENNSLKGEALDSHLG